MKMPEPVAHLSIFAVDDVAYLPKLRAHHFPSKDSKPLFTEEQLKQYGRDLLEEAAKKCDALYFNLNAGPDTCAKAIRKLKETL